MIAVTIGVGPYKLMAQYAARAFEEATGVETVVLNDQHFLSSGHKTPHYLKLKVFDFVSDNTILYFDADMVCLGRWNPIRHARCDAIVAVAERQHPMIYEACHKWQIPFDEYINTGLLFLDRSIHAVWFQETERFIRDNPPLPLFDQTPLNILRCNLDLRLDLIDRRFNWLGYGNGPLCYRMEVFMAHTILPPSKQGNIEFFEGRYSPPFGEVIGVDETQTAILIGKTFVIKDSEHDTTLHLRSDRTVACRNFPRLVHYWFVYSDHTQLILALTSETDVVQEYEMTNDGSECIPIRQHESPILRKNLTLITSVQAPVSPIPGIAR